MEDLPTYGLLVLVDGFHFIAKAHRGLQNRPTCRYFLAHCNSQILSHCTKKESLLDVELKTYNAHVPNINCVCIYIYI